MTFSMDVYGQFENKQTHEGIRQNRIGQNEISAKRSRNDDDEVVHVRH